MDLAAMYEDPTVRARVAEQLDRVAREERQWRSVRLHASLHKSWLPADECARCLDDRDAERLS